MKTPLRRHELFMVPLKDLVVFPHMVVPLFVGRDKSIKALEWAMSHEKEVFLSAQRDAKVDTPAQKDIYLFGTMGTVLQLLRLPDGTVKALIEGKQRARIEEFVPNQDFFMVKMKKFYEDDADEQSIALMRAIAESFDEYAKLNEKIGKDLVSTISAIEDPCRLADTIAAHVTMKLRDKQEILQVEGLNPRLEKLFDKLRDEINILRLENRLKKRVKKQMEKTQKDYYLNEQMRAIQKEMGEKDDFSSEIEELEKRLKGKKLSEEAQKKVKHEIKKLKMMSPMSAEATVVRNYIDWLLDMPWQEKTDNKHTLKESEAILEEDHYGLKKVKERILEYLAVQSLVKKNKGSILCLVGPPGVGKTSIAKSIARATNRKFVRLSLGGLRDEAEIRGHRRTYIGALPGKIIQLIKKAGSNNPVLCLDEIDKLSSDFRGDPSSALLEVLDPEQNGAFNDNYLEVDYDLSDVMFITTANILQTIPGPLQDRMEVIRIAGYTEPEKLNIAKRFLVKKEIEANGLTDKHILFTDGAILDIIRRYTREAGVRNLEREIASICRKVAREIVTNGHKKQIRINSKSIEKYLGIPKYRFGESEGKESVGLTQGLAWTEVGGELLIVEATILPGTGKTILTGKLGDVMQESAQAALTIVRSKADALGLDKNFYKDTDIHVHVPEGAIPKDGPSAGIAMVTSIASAFTKRAVRGDLAMTGEITLRGRVLPIGGLKEKLLAAHRGGIKTVIVPKENEKDLVDIPSNVLKDLELKMVERIDEVLEAAFVHREGQEIPLEVREEIRPIEKPAEPERHIHASEPLKRREIAEKRELRP